MSTYKYWQHFLALESDFAQTARFVEFERSNFGVYSVEFLKLLMAVGSEIDVLCKVLCACLGPTEKRGNIDEYRACINGHSDIALEEVLIRRYALSFKPWTEWANGKNPPWWRSYNNVKHERNLRMSEANLENCAQAMSALFVLVLYCHKAEGSSDDLVPGPMLLGRDGEPGSLLLESGYTIPAFR